MNIKLETRTLRITVPFFSCVRKGKGLRNCCNFTPQTYRLGLKVSEM